MALPVGQVRNKQPRISIITPCLNRASLVGDAIESVLDQGYANLEHIIVDGGSTDGTLDVLARYPHLHPISESDVGMYDALNKGLSLATGDIIGFLNTDDLYPKGALVTAARGLGDSSASFLVGQAEIFSHADESIIRLLSSTQLDNLLKKSIVDDTRFNAFFFRREVFEQIGNFDRSYRIVADREFLMRMALAEISGLEVQQVLYRYRAHPGSMTFGIDEGVVWPVLEEYFVWTDQCLRQGGFTAEAKELLIQLHTRVTILAAGQRLLTREIAGAIHYAREGVRYDPSWVLRFMCYALNYSARRAARLVIGATS